MFRVTVRVVAHAVVNVLLSWIGAGVFLYDIYWLYKDKILFTIEQKKDMRRFFRVRAGKLVESVAIWPNLHLNWFEHAGVKIWYLQLAFLLWYVELSHNTVKYD